MMALRKCLSAAVVLALVLVPNGDLVAAAKKKSSKRQPTGLKEEGKDAKGAKNNKTKSEQKVETPTPAPEPTQKNDSAEVLVQPENPLYKDKELDELASSLLDDVERDQLAVSARFDLAFLTGNSVMQGFSLPSVRVSVWGDVTSILSYRVSFGQTREFTSALLPQILPVEAYIDMGSTDARSRGSRFAIRVGMFTPSQNPWWTPDLSDLPLPSYNRSHREIYLFRDLGAELRYESESRNFEAALGVFNGVGLFSQNTNNSKAGTAYLKGQIPFGEWSLYAGLGGYGLAQSTAGNVNFKRNWTATGFFGVSSQYGILQGEYSVGEFMTSTSTQRPLGGAVMGFARLSPRLKLFVRYESLVAPPSGGGGTLKFFQVGPVLELHETLTLFGTYSQTQEADGSPLTHSGEVRFRLNV